MADTGLIATAIVLAWLCGFRVYLTAFALGLAQALSLVSLSGPLALLDSPWVLAASGCLCLIEFVTDKIPGVDSVWDLGNTFVRIPAGAVAAGWAVAPDLSGPSWGWLATGAGVALMSHGLKLGARAVLNLSPEPVSNWTASFGEDVVGLFVIVLLLTSPRLALAVALSVFVLSVAIVWLMWRAIRRALRRGRALPS